MRHKAIAGFSILLLAAAAIYVQNALLIPLKPESNASITQKQPQFEWVGNANKLFVDDNDEFTTPIVERVQGNQHRLSKELDFKEYYWKLAGNKNSSVSKFRVESVVALNVEKKNDSYTLTNAGNADLEIVKRDASFTKVTGMLTLPFSGKKEVEVLNKTYFVARQR